MADEKTQSTEAMFSTIAARYDRCNRLFSLGIDRRWRKQLAQAVASNGQETALDVCCGTGEMAFALLKHSSVKTVVGIDCSERMIQLAQEKRIIKSARRWMAHKTLRLRVEDAAQLTSADETFDAATAAFGLRNILDYAAALRQMYRVLKPGGRVGICEFSLPKQRAVRAVYWFYLSRVMPSAGRMVLGSGDALRHLAQSIQRWDRDVQLEAELAHTGFVDVRSQALTGGIATITTGRKPSS